MIEMSGQLIGIHELREQLARLMDDLVAVFGSVGSDDVLTQAEEEAYFKWSDEAGTWLADHGEQVLLLLERVRPYGPVK